MTARLTTAGLALLVIAATSAGCSSSERSVSAFCETLASEQERILREFESQLSAAEASGDDFVSAFGGIAASVSALGEVAIYLDKLEKVAPPEIETDMAEIASVFRDQLDSAGDVLDNPLSALAGGLFDSFRIAGSLERVNDFAQGNCGQSL